MTVEYVHDSVEYIRVQMTVEKNGAVFDPTSDVVKMTFTEEDSLVGTESWYVGSWETAGSKYFARCLVGPAPGLVELTHGTWFVWVKVTDSPEVPIKRAGVVEVY